MSTDTINDSLAFGAPGMDARWTASAKTAVGTSLSNESCVWFTASHGILNEIYYPSIDIASTRDMGFIVTNGTDFFSEEKRNTKSEVLWLSPAVPAFKIVNTCALGRYRIEKEIITDPKNNTLLQSIKFFAEEGALSDYHLYVIIAPHLGNQGNDNTAWSGIFDKYKFLFAQRDNLALALTCSIPWLKSSCGYVGFSDGWQDLSKNKKMTWEFSRADNGNIAMIAEINLVKSKGKFTLALGFGKNSEAAAQHAITSLNEGFVSLKKSYMAEWKTWLSLIKPKKKNKFMLTDFAMTSMSVLRMHESKSVSGGYVASLSIPWGFSKDDSDLGYHLIWSRDMVEVAGGLLAGGAYAEVKRVLSFLQTTQQTDGHWAQNMMVNGQPFWNGIQMDETALPILLINLAIREKILTQSEIKKLWPMVRKAALYIILNGPISPEDRWEEDPGYTPFTLAAQISALLVTAELAETNDDIIAARYFRETADIWYSCIDRWLYVTETEWTATYNIQGYYVRIAPLTGNNLESSKSNVQIKNVAVEDDSRRARYLVSPDALALVRFGLRDAQDIRITDTLKVIDEKLKIDTPAGSTWHRYNDDGYGEHADGKPFDGVGIGRGWPLLTGERAHFELAAGDHDEAAVLAQSMEKFANASGLISEQVWDSDAIPSCELYIGRPSGSAMPLVWAHAEYIKLRRSLHDGRVFDLPSQTVKRYLTDKKTSNRIMWRYNHKTISIDTNRILRIELLASALIHWTVDEWETMQDTATQNSGLGIHYADLPTGELSSGTTITFTFFWIEVERWEGENFTVSIV
jgi:glucoamylase